MITTNSDTTYFLKMFLVSLFEEGSTALEGVVEYAGKEYEITVREVEK